MVGSTTGAVGGPLGRWARIGSTWWSPLRVLVAIATFSYLLGYVLDLSCRSQGWRSPERYEHLCYTDIAPLYSLRGFADGLIPYVQAMPDGQHLEYPVLTGGLMQVAALITSAITGIFPTDSPATVFFDVNVVLLFIAFVVTVAATALTVRRRPWDAAHGGARPDDDPRRHGQLGPAAARLHRARAPAVGAAASVRGRAAPRAGRRGQVLPGALPRRVPRPDHPHGEVAGLRPPRRRHRSRLARGERAVHAREHGGLVVLLPVQPDARRGLRLDLVRALAGGAAVDPRGPAQHGGDRAVPAPVRGDRLGDAGGEASAAPGERPVPHRGRLRADQQGLLTAVRALARPAGGDGPAEVARLPHLAGRPGRLLRGDLVVPRRVRHRRHDRPHRARSTRWRSSSTW